MKRHVKSHLPPGFYCDHCEKGFSRKDCLTRHYKSQEHHETMAGVPLRNRRRGRPTLAQVEYTDGEDEEDNKDVKDVKGD